MAGPTSFDSPEAEAEARKESVKKLGQAFGYSDKVGQVKQCLADGVDIDGFGPSGYTAVGLAVRYEKPDIARILLENGENVHIGFRQDLVPQLANLSSTGAGSVPVYRLHPPHYIMFALKIQEMIWPRSWIYS